MSTYIKIIHAHEFIKATPKGELDLKETKEVLCAIALASVPLDNYEIILDIRKAHAEMSVGDLYYLAAELCKFYEAFSKKMAVICPLNEFDHTEFFALCAQNRGFQVSAFTSLGDAMEWLIGNETNAVIEVPQLCKV